MSLSTALLFLVHCKVFLFGWERGESLLQGGLLPCASPELIATRAEAGARLPPGCSDYGKKGADPPLFKTGPFFVSKSDMTAEIAPNWQRRS